MRTTRREMDVERLDGRRLNQRISKVMWSLRSSSCSITSREVAHAVHEPVFVPGPHGQAGDEKDDFRRLRYRRSLVTPLPSQHRCLRMQRREMGASGSTDPALLPSHRRPTTATTSWAVGKSCREKLPPASSRRSLSYYGSEKKGGEMEREDKRTAMRNKEVEVKATKKKLLSNSYGFTSSSSEDSDNDGAGAVEVLFASDETETLFSSRSFSSDSSEFYYSSSCRCGRGKKRNPRRRRERQQKLQREEEGEESKHRGTWVDGFGRPFVFFSSSSSSLSGSDRSTHENMAPATSEVMEEEEEMEATGSTTAGFAVEKQSNDPREDFRSSMLEMIMEKQVFGDRDLESLLVRYLSLNHPHHHPVIVEVFSEIRETLFGH